MEELKLIYFEITPNQAKKLEGTLDIKAIQATANSIYGWNYVSRDTYIQTERAMDPLDNSKPGYLFAGSEYLGQVVRDLNLEFWVRFNRNTEGAEIYPLTQFTIEPVKAEAPKVEGSRLAQALINKEVPVEVDTTTENIIIPKLAMFTGHREINDDKVFPSAVNLLRELEADGGVAGGAKGADYTAARAVKECELPLHLIIPQEDGYYNAYKPVAKENWDAMIAYAIASGGSVRYSMPKTVKWHYSFNFKRNTDLIEAANIFIVVSIAEPGPMGKQYAQGQTRGGTANCVAQMQRMGINQAWWIHANTGKTKLVNL